MANLDADISTQKLSEAYLQSPPENSMEITVHTININKGHSPAVMRHSKALRDYSILIDLIRQLQGTGLSLENSIRSAIQQCIQADVMKSFLMRHGSEVVSDMTHEWTIEDLIRVRSEEAAEKAAADQAIELAQMMLADGLPDSTILKYTKLTAEQLAELKDILAE